MILVDTREKKHQTILSYFERHNIPYKHIALKTGDYMLEGNNKVTIDRKRNLDEVWGNLFSKGNKERFMREIKRAKKDNMQFILLIEHGRIKSVSDIAKWRSKYGMGTGEQIVNRLYELNKVWGVEVEFCDKKSTGRIIAERLGVINGQRRN